MPLPIPIGGISKSSQNLDEPNTTQVSSHELTGDEESKTHSTSWLYQSVAWASCPFREWQARVIASFYDVVHIAKGGEDRNGDSTPTPQVSNDNSSARKDTFACSPNNRVQTIVELKIQISHLSRPLQSSTHHNMRETTHRLPLMDGAYHDRYPSSQQPRVVFSHDRKFLSVLLFHPHQQSPTVVIFQLRRPRETQSQRHSPQMDSIPIPSYIISNQSTMSNGHSYPTNNNQHVSADIFPLGTPAIATNPKFVSVWGITAMCSLPIPMTTTTTTTMPSQSQTSDMSVESTPASLPSMLIPRSMLLTICQDGSLVWIDLKSAQAIATGSLPKLSCSDHDSSTSSQSSLSSCAQLQSIFPIISMQASPSSSLHTGTVAMVTSTSPSSTHDSSERVSNQSKKNEIHHIASSAECLLISWSLQSTTPKQQTLLKRASTGTVTTTTASPDRYVDRDGKNTIKQKNRLAPQRTFSDTLHTLLTSPSTTVHGNNLGGINPKVASSLKETRNLKRSSSQRSPSKWLQNSDVKAWKTPMPRKERSLFRTKSMERNTVDLADRLQKMNLLPVSFNSKTRENRLEEEAVEQRKLFVRQELQRRHPAGSWVAQEHQQQLFARELDQNDEHITMTTRKESDRSRSSLQRTSLLGNKRRASSRSITSTQAIEHSSASVQDKINGDEQPLQPLIQRRHLRRRSNPGTSDSTPQKPEMKVEVLSSWSGSLGNKEGEHQHTNSKKVVAGVCFGVLSTVLCVVYRSTSTELERRQRVAQILTISENGYLQPVASLFLSRDSLQQATSVGSSANQSEEVFHRAANPSNDDRWSLFGVEFDPCSDTFIVNSIIGMWKYWVACVWNWRVDSIGWMIKQPLVDDLVWSRLYIGQDPQRGSHFIHIEAIQGNLKANTSSATIGTTKRIISLALLSPSHCRSLGLSEPSTLLLSSTQVGFASVTKKAADTSVLRLQWKMTSLPTPYVTTCGPSSIAAVGVNSSKSLGVASRQGLCVWDSRYRYKWKQFGTPAEEKLFVVLAIVWWEGRRLKRKSVHDDDLLIAIIKIKATGELYLSCWSSKQLDPAHQLMDTPEQHWQEGESQEVGRSWGIPLLHQVSTIRMSLLEEPRDNANLEGNFRKAGLVLYTTDQHEAEFDYLVYGLQVTRKKASKQEEQTAQNESSYVVMGHRMLQGRVKNGIRSVGPVSSIFLAGGSFRFDLRRLLKMALRKSSKQNDFFVVLGVFRTPGGTESVYLGSNGEVRVATVVKSEVSQFWLSDIIHWSTLLGSDGPPVATFAWTIQLANGELISWSVPSVLECRKGQSDDWRILSELNEGTIQRPKGLRLPSSVCNLKLISADQRCLLGTLCELGKVSDWIQRSSSNSEMVVSMGHVPDSKFGCILQSGMLCRHNAESQPVQDDNGIFHERAGRIDTLVPAAFLMTPPAYATSLFLLLVEAATLRMDFQSTKDLGIVSSHGLRLQIIKKHVENRLVSAPHKDAMMMALRLLVFRSVDMLSKLEKKHSLLQSDASESDLLLGKTLFTELVDAVRCCTSKLQFSSLFLEVGRQIEPSSLPHLFPLPISNQSTTADARSVVELFSLCLEERALTAAASALPLLSSKSLARHYAGLLLDEALDTFIRNTHSRSRKYDFCEEERKVLGDVFRFGMKLEDADWEEEKVEAKSSNHRSGSVDDRSMGSLDRTDGSRTTNDDISVLLQDSENKSHFICGMNGSHSILNYIVPSKILAEHEKEKEEEAIRREASSFIRGSLDNPSLDFVSLPNWDEGFLSTQSVESDINSVGGLIGDALLDLLQSSRTDNNWTAMGALAKMILQDNIEILTSFKLPAKIAARAQPLDILTILPESYSGDETCADSLQSYLGDEIDYCSQQLSTKTARWVLDMTLIVLDRLAKIRLPDEGDQSVMELGLVMIVLVAGHLCGMSQEIVEEMSQGDSIIRTSYQRLIIVPTTAGS